MVHGYGAAMFAPMIWRLSSAIGWHTRIVQWFQATLEHQNWAAGDGTRMPLAARLIAATPVLRDIRNRAFVYGGLWPERVSIARRDVATRQA